jgi:hypothetical protein
VSVFFEALVLAADRAGGNSGTGRERANTPLELHVVELFSPPSKLHPHTVVINIIDSAHTLGAHVQYKREGFL